MKFVAKALIVLYTAVKRWKTHSNKEAALKEEIAITTDIWFKTINAMIDDDKKTTEYVEQVTDALRDYFNNKETGNDKKTRHREVL